MATLMAAAAGVISMAKLIAYVRLEGFRLSIPQLTLEIQLAAALFRVGITSTDPIYAGLAFPAVAAHMTTTISFPLNFVSLILLTLYWQEILEKSKIHITSFLTKLRIPFIVASIILYVAEIIASLVRAIRFGIKIEQASTISAAFYIIFLLSLSIFFFVVGGKVIYRLRISKKLTAMKGAVSQNSRRTSSLWRVTVMLVLTGVFNLIFISSFVIAVFDAFFYSPGGFHLSWTLMYLGVLGGSLSQVAAVKWPFNFGFFLTGRPGASSIASSASKSTDGDNSAPSDEEGAIVSSVAEEDSDTGEL